MKSDIFTSPDISFGNRVSRSCAKLRDSFLFLIIFSDNTADSLLNLEETDLGGYITFIKEKSSYDRVCLTDPDARSFTSFLNDFILKYKSKNAK